MKHLIILVALMLLCAAGAKAQSVDLLYLKNGSIIRGTILEVNPTQSVKIQTADLSIYVYPMSEVEKTGKDTAMPPAAVVPNYYVPGYPQAYPQANQQPAEPKVDTRSVNGFRVILESGFVSYDMVDPGVQFNLALGARMLNGHLFYGLGAGLDTDFDYFNLTPFTLLKYNILNRTVSPYIAVRPGYSFIDGDGFYMSADLGCHFRFNKRSGIYTAFTYVMQDGDYGSISSIGAKIGFEF